MEEVPETISPRREVEEASLYEGDHLYEEIPDYYNRVGEMG